MQPARQLGVVQVGIPGQLGRGGHGLEQRTQDLEAQEAISRPELRSRLVDIYKLGQGRYLRVLLSTSDVRQIGQASRTLAALARIDHDRVVSRQRTLDDLKTVRKTLEGRRRQLNVLRMNAEHAEAALTRAARTIPSAPHTTASASTVTARVRVVTRLIGLLWSRLSSAVAWTT